MMNIDFPLNQMSATSISIWIATNQDLALYLAPSILCAALIRFLSNVHPIFFVFRLIGTIFHELGHYFCGLLTNARPCTFSIIPHRAGDTWQLGAVEFRNIRWYNAAPTALAPFALLAIPFLVANWRVQDGLHFQLMDLPLTLVIAPQFLSFWPSVPDWKIALRSWPYLAFAGGAWYLIG